MKVSDFIQQGKWNDELIHQQYWVGDAELILKIPLSPYDHPDSWFWHYTGTGNYSVKSGYNLAICAGRSGPSSSADVLSAWWKDFWVTKIPWKMLLFGWRGFHEILPTTKGLYHRNVTSHSNCPLCGFWKDSNAHAVFWCPFAQGVWGILDYPFLVGHKEEIFFKDVLLYATKLLERESFAKLLVYAWGIWTERNKKTHGQQSRSLHQLKTWLSSYYEDFHKVQDNEVDVRREEVMTQGVQADVQAISMPNKMVGMGAAIIGANNRVKAALSKPLKGTLSVFHAESLAVLVGLRWAQNIGLPIKKTFSDSLSLVQALDNTNNYHNELGILLNDIKMLMANFPEADISHVNRKYNTTAHNLAKQALQLDEDFLDGRNPSLYAK